MTSMRDQQPAVAPVQTGAGGLFGGALSSLGSAIGIPMPGAMTNAAGKAADLAANEAIDQVTGTNMYDRERNQRNRADEAAHLNYSQEQNNSRHASALNAMHGGLDSGQANHLSAIAHRQETEHQQQALHMAAEATHMQVKTATETVNMENAQMEAALHVGHQRKMQEIAVQEQSAAMALEEQKRKSMMDATADKAKQEEEEHAKIKATQEDMNRKAMDTHLQQLMEQRANGGDEEYVRANIEAVQHEMKLLDANRAQDREVTRNKKLREMKKDKQKDIHDEQSFALCQSQRDTHHQAELTKSTRKFTQEEALSEIRFTFDERKKKSQLDIEHANAVFLEAQALKEQRRDQYKLTLKTLGIGAEDMRKEGGKSCRASFTKLFFLTITLACEVDMYGFVLAVLQYSTIGEDVEGYEYPSRANYLMRALLITGPVAYLVAIFAYLSRQSGKGTVVGDGNLPLSERTDRDPLGFNDLLFTLPEEPFTLKHFHYIPIYRCYILIKDLMPDDVEALFRVNGLSTFTLGFSQMVCLLLAGSEGLLKVDDVTMKVVLVNQFFNFVVTMIYFSSTIANQMKGSTKVDAMKYNLRERMQREYVRFNDAVNQHSLRRSAFTQKVVDDFHAMAAEEIKQLAKMPEVDLSIFSMEEKFDIRRCLRIKEINGFTEMCKV